MEVILGAIDGIVYIYNNDGKFNSEYETGEWIEDIAVGDIRGDD